MANLNSSKKNIRKIAKRTVRNRAVKSTLKTLAKKVQAAQLSGDAAAAKASAVEYISALDKAAKRGIIHINKAHRHKASLSKVVFAT